MTAGPPRLLGRRGSDIRVVCLVGSRGRGIGRGGLSHLLGDEELQKDSRSVGRRRGRKQRRSGLTCERGILEAGSYAHGIQVDFVDVGSFPL